MLKFNVQKILLSVMLIAVLAGMAEPALAVVAGDLGAVAESVGGTLDEVAKLITGAAYVAGMAFAVGAIAKFKQHKENPTQIPISQPIVFLLVGIALMFCPQIFKVGGKTLFADDSAAKAGVQGIYTF